MYIAQKAYLRVSSALFQKRNGCHVTSLMSNSGSSYKKGLKSPLSWVLGVWNRITYRKSWSVNLLPLLNLTFCSCFKDSGIIKLKRPYISLIIVPGVWNEKTLYMKSWPLNLLQVSVLTFDHTGKALYLPRYCSYGLKLGN